MAEQVTRSLNMPGIWWLPNTDNETLGTLRWMPNVGCRLELVGDSHEFKWGESLDIIWGLNSEQKPITLVGCRHLGHSGGAWIGNASSVRHALSVRMALVGYLCKKESEIALTDLYAEYAGLDEYVLQRYYGYERTQDSEGKYNIGPITFSIPTYEMARFGEAEVGLFVGWSMDSGIRLQHKLHFSFQKTNLYKSEGTNFRLVHVILPAFLSAMMGHRSFQTSLTSPTENALLEIYDGFHERMMWDGNPRFRDRLVLGQENTLKYWPTILPAWVENYQTISKLCSAYVKILTDEEDGFLNINNLVHLFFGLERYHKTKCSLPKSSLEEALRYSVKCISEYFQSVSVFTRAASEVDVNSLVRARQVLVHANEGEPDYKLVYQQLIFITRCVFLMEMEYPVANVRQETQHWSQWQFFKKRR